MNPLELQIMLLMISRANVLIVREHLQQAEPLPHTEIIEGHVAT